MSAVRRRARWLRRQYLERKRRYFDELDKETIAGFQRGYYPVIMIAGLYLAVGADAPTTALADTLGPKAYLSWLALHFICPPAALIGRRVYDNTTLAIRRKFGARLQLIGDAGIWAAICIYAGCLWNTAYWGQAIYPSFFLLMGIPGGFRFTVRSVRRLRGITTEERP